MSDLVYFKKSKLDALADKINEKCGGVEPISLDEMVAKAEDIRLIEMLESRTALGYAMAYSSLSTFPYFKVNETVKSMNYFCINSKFTNFPKLDTSKVKTFEYAFSNCYIKEITIDSSSATNMIGAFSSNNYLVTISKLDVSKCVTADSLKNTFHYCTSLKNVSFVENSIHVSVSFAYCSLLSAESVQSIIDGLATVTTAQTITFYKDIALSDEQKQIINDKGWTLVQA
nr:MAG TPA: hypothetical protein [Caudovirales sp. ctMlE25]